MKKPAAPILLWTRRTIKFFMLQCGSSEGSHGFFHPAAMAAGFIRVLMAEKAGVELTSNFQKTEFLGESVLQFLQRTPKQFTLLQNHAIPGYMNQTTGAKPGSETAQPETLQQGHFTSVC